MNNENERLKELRIHLGLNQEQLGESIGITKSGISSIESGIRKLSEKHVKLLCAAYPNLNKEWLRNGTGSMFIETTSVFLDQLAAKHNFTELERKIFDCYVDLKPEYRNAVQIFVQSVIDSCMEAATVAITEPATESSDAPYPYEKDFDNLTKEEQMQIISAELDEKRKGIESQVSTPMLSDTSSKMA